MKKKTTKSKRTKKPKSRELEARKTLDQSSSRLGQAEVVLTEAAHLVILVLSGEHVAHEQANLVARLLFQYKINHPGPLEARFVVTAVHPGPGISAPTGPASAEVHSTPVPVTGRSSSYTRGFGQ